MDRRQFCKTSFIAGLAVGSPILAGCGRRANTEASIPAISLDGAEIELSNAAIQELSESLSGPMILSGHPDYDTARTIWNGMHDKRPALIVRPADSRDVSQAVSFARDNNLLLAVRGGGHSWPGKSVCDGGLMIDLSQMSSVVADRDTQRANAQGGALLGALDTACLDQGMVTTADATAARALGLREGPYRVPPRAAAHYLVAFEGAVEESSWTALEMNLPAGTVAFRRAELSRERLDEFMLEPRELHDAGSEFHARHTDRGPAGAGTQD